MMNEYFSFVCKVAPLQCRLTFLCTHRHHSLTAPHVFTCSANTAILSSKSFGMSQVCKTNVASFRASLSQSPDDPQTYAEGHLRSERSCSSGEKSPHVQRLCLRRADKRCFDVRAGRYSGRAHTQGMRVCVCVHTYVHLHMCTSAYASIPPSHEEKMPFFGSLALGMT